MSTKTDAAIQSNGIVIRKMHKGTVKTLPATLFNLTGADGKALTVTVSTTAVRAMQGGAEIGRVNAAFAPEDELTVALTGGKLYVRRRYERGLFPAESLEPSVRLFPRASQFSVLKYMADAVMADMTVVNVKPGGPGNLFAFAFQVTGPLGNAFKEAL